MACFIHYIYASISLGRRKDIIVLSPEQAMSNRHEEDVTHSVVRKSFDFRGFEQCKDKKHNLCGAIVKCVLNTYMFDISFRYRYQEPGLSGAVRVGPDLYRRAHTLAANFTRNEKKRRRHWT